MSAPSHEYFAELDRRLTELVEQVRAVAPALVLDMAVEYLDHGEYGLALIGLVELVLEHDVSLPPEVAAEAAYLGEMMEISPSSLLQPDPEVIAWLRQHRPPRSEDV